jgi:hypothetical protein
LFYAETSEKAPLNFIKTVDLKIEQICENPYLSVNKYKNYHEIILAKYPVSLIYTIEEEIKCNMIVSIFHHSRKPLFKYKSKMEK